MWKLCLIATKRCRLFLFLLLAIPATAQTVVDDPCGGAHDPHSLTEQHSQQLLAALGSNWGYGYADLLNDLAAWRSSPYVRVDSIGRSVQGRALWQLTITSATIPTTPRQTVIIHARTHPGEVQSWWVANEMIRYLLSDDQRAAALRHQLVFHIIPMYNPDGVELQYPRENANKIDLEREWDKPNPQPEAAALKARFTELMNSTAPINVALNLHSAYLCQRYFVYHDQNGTSREFARSQQLFIGKVRNFWPEGIQPWDYYKSWDTGTPRVFPESWYWLNYGPAVMAMTYEDMNCDQAGNYDLTARAILHGVGEYLGVPMISSVEPEQSNGLRLTVQQSSGAIHYHLPSQHHTQLLLFDLLGREVAQLVDQELPAGNHTAQLPDDLPSGRYRCQLRSGNLTNSAWVVVVR